MFQKWLLYLKRISYTLTASFLLFSLIVPIVDAEKPDTQAQFIAQKTQQVQGLKKILKEKQKVKIIIEMNTPFQPEGKLDNAEKSDQHNRIAKVQNTIKDHIAENLPIQAKTMKGFKTIPYLTLEVDSDGLDVLLNDVNVKSIVEDVPIPFNSVVVKESMDSPYLVDSTNIINTEMAWSQGYTGKDQTVAILDTGVDKTHPFLSNKVVSEACYSTTNSNNGSESLCPGGVGESTASNSGLDCTGIEGCGHGTHVAGIAAGKGDAFSGVAKDAKIIAIKVFSKFTPQACNSSTYCISSYTSDIISGLERVYQLSSQFHISSVNMSLGGGRSYSTCDDDPTKAIIDNLKSLGIATVIASGNEGYKDSVSAPGCVSSAVTVGATTKYNDVADFSNSYSYLDLLAPGVNITSANNGGGFIEESGTSMAAPHVAGAWAVLKQKYPNASVDEILNMIQNGGVPITDIANNITKPRLDFGWMLNINNLAEMYKQDFENSNGQFALTGTNNSWEWGIPTTGPVSGSITKLWGTNLDGNYNNDEVSYIESPAINLTAATSGVVVSWDQWMNLEKGYDYSRVEVSKDGGQTWVLKNSSTGASGWKNKYFALDNSYATSNFRIRFGIASDSTETVEGLYIDNIKVRQLSGVPLPAKGNVENPPSGATLSGNYNVTGWFLDGAGVSKIEVLVDGAVAGQVIYGDARADVKSAFPDYNNGNAGFHYTLDTTKYSNGSHTITVKETASNSNVATLPAVTVTISNALPPKGNVENPASGATLSGNYNVKGWFLDGAGVSKIEVLVDGVLAGQAIYGDARADVKTAFPDYNNGNAGFHYSLDTSKYSNGNHTITIKETANNSNVTTLPAVTVTISNALPPKGNVENPASGATLSGNYNVKGWFLDGAGVSKIEVLVDGVLAGQAIYGDARADVKTAFPDYNNGNAGFHYTLDTSKYSNGNHTITVKETANNSNVTTLPAITVTISNALPPKGNVENPASGATLSGSYNVKGWFLDGAGVSKVEVLVDGVLAGQAIYGDARADVKSAFPDYNNGNAGFHYTLDTTKYSNGSHTITVKETASNSNVTTLPAITVTISNGSPPKGNVENPSSGAMLSGNYNVKGWFLDGAGVSKIEVLVDGVLAGQAIYGDARADVKTVFPDYNNGNAGFHYTLDTTKYSNGNHTITVKETANNSNVTTLPAITVTISNALPPKGNVENPFEI
ncbi:S8 family serine peptidase [Cohnella sp. CFH 77786]|uniref:Ig-like domain-containing protein n=1 Tax=Cohnella sp. CFH 77786 TaxID=2662265 RepID=UPI001C60CE90|nr:Ig-like domain-containing protein [Cohnella sp. CFH 77786]MBW5445889.1 S8 family serine peptidase [Cohnella sp. CFH 77786]